MKQFLLRLTTLGLFLLSVGCFYCARVLVFSSAFINIALFVIAIFVLFQACGNADKLLGYGKYSTLSKNEETPKCDEETPTEDVEEKIDTNDADSKKRWKRRN